jgi:ubiquinone/menaquinone biosynthesis C-methylase UbiE
VEETQVIIETAATPEQARRVYDLWSHFYGWWAPLFERRPQMLALEKVVIRRHEKVLEVAVGAGGILVEIVRRVDPTNVVYGIDVSPKMLAKARRKVMNAGYNNIDLREADARSLPFPDNTFDVLFNSYMFDLLPLNDIPTVLGEFRRVLKPNGRLVLVNMSKEDGGRRTWWERLYESLPRTWAAYLLGSCRPVLLEAFVQDAGFGEVKREFIRGLLPSEIVFAKKPEQD